MDFFNQEIFQNNWFRYGFLLIVFIPLLVIIFNELIYTLQRKHEELTPPIKTFKNYILPLIALSIVLTQVLDFTRTSTVMKILETFIWILVVNAILAIINTLFFSGKKNSVVQTKIPQLFLDIFRVVMVLLGIAIALSVVWGFDLGSMVTALGLGSFVIGLALQDTLGNLFSGIALVYERPFKEGDIICVEDYTGRVIEMNWRAIRLETREKEMIVIPHLVIGQGTIKNYSMPTKIHIMKKEIGFGYDIPPNKIKETLMKTCYDTPGILSDPEPEVKTNDYGENKIIYEIEFAIADFKDHEDIMDDFMSRVWYTAKRYQLTMPLPQRVIRNVHESTSTRDINRQKLESSLQQLPKMLPIEKSRIMDLADGAIEQFFGKDEIIIHQGDSTGYLYVILEGEASVSTKNKEGKEFVISQLQKGDFFGEIALFSSRTSAFTVQALQDLKVLTIFPDEVLELVEKNPKLAFYLDEMMDIRRSKMEALKRV